MSSATANVSDEVIINVNLTGMNGQSFSSLTYWAYYDSTKVNLLGFDFSNTIIPNNQLRFSENFNESSSLGILNGPCKKINFGFFATNSISSEGTLVKLRFKVLASETSQINRYYFALGDIAIGSSGGQILVNSLPSATSILIPVNNSGILVEGLPTEILSFNWGRSVDPNFDAISYQVELAAVASFSSSSLLSIQTTSTNVRFSYKTIDDLLNSLGVSVGQTRTLFARVRSSDAFGTTTGALSTFNFTRGVVNTPPTSAEITAPSDGSDLDINGFQFAPFVPRWTESTDADGDNVSYNWQLSSNPDFNESTILVEYPALVDEQINLSLDDILNVLEEGGIVIDNSSVTLYHRAQATDGKVLVNGISKTFILSRIILDIGEVLPASFKLNQNYPKPFNPITTRNNQKGESRIVRLMVYNALGSEVATLVNGRQAAGSYNVSFDASLLSTGIYIYRLEAGSFVYVRKMTLIR